jgi:predicted DNA-binding protein YlxM (UPF0122 family)
MRIPIYNVIVYFMITNLNYSYKEVGNIFNISSQAIMKTFKKTCKEFYKIILNEYKIEPSTYEKVEYLFDEMLNKVNVQLVEVGRRKEYQIEIIYGKNRDDHDWIFVSKNLKKYEYSNINMEKYINHFTDKIKVIDRIKEICLNVK